MMAVCASSADYSAATGASALLAQAAEWHISPNEVNHATAGNTFMLGVGGLAAVWLSAYIGRLPTLFYFMTLSCATAIWAAAAQSFESYMAARILNGFFAVAAAGGGLMWINDIFFFHQRPRKVNMWSVSLILSPFVGPAVMAGVLNTSTWRVGMWVNVGLIGTGLLLVIAVGDETFYPRHLSREQIPPRKSRILRLLGYEQWKTNYTTNSFLEAGSRSYNTILRLPVILTCVFYFFDCKRSSARYESEHTNGEQSRGPSPTTLPSRFSSSQSTTLPMVTLVQFILLQSSAQFSVLCLVTSCSTKSAASTRVTIRVASNPKLVSFCAGLSPHSRL